MRLDVLASQTITRRSAPHVTSHLNMFKSLVHRVFDPGFVGKQNINVTMSYGIPSSSRVRSVNVYCGLYLLDIIVIS